MIISYSVKYKIFYIDGYSSHFLLNINFLVLLVNYQDHLLWEQNKKPRYWVP